MTEPVGQKEQSAVVVEERPQPVVKGKRADTTETRARVHRSERDDAAEIKLKVNEDKEELPSIDQKASSTSLYGLLRACFTNFDQNLSGLLAGDRAFRSDLLLLRGLMEKNALQDWDTKRLFREFQQWNTYEPATDAHELVRREVVGFIRAALAKKFEEGDISELIPDTLSPEVHSTADAPREPAMRRRVEPPVEHSDGKVSAKTPQEATAEYLERTRLTPEQLAERERAREKARGEGRIETDPRQLAVLLAGQEGYESLTPEQMQKVIAGIRSDGLPTVGHLHGEYGPSGEFATPRNEKSYDEVKQELLTPGRSWDEYGWSVGEIIKIKELFQDETVMSDGQAKIIMAALLLHGKTGHEVIQGLFRAMTKTREGTMGYLTKLGILKDDDDVLNIFCPTPDEKKTFLERTYLVEEPGNFQDLVWQMTQRGNKIFKRGNAAALLTNWVAEQQTEVDGHTGERIKRFKFFDRVNTDLLDYWFDHLAMEEHGNATTSPLDFEQKITIEKGVGGIPIDIYRMVAYRTKEMFDDKHEKGVRYAWVADLFEALAIILSKSRNHGIVLKQTMGDAEELQKQEAAAKLNNDYLRDVNGRTLLEQTFRLSERGSGRKTGDGKTGAAIITMYSAYCSVLSPEKMARVLGFTKIDQHGNEIGDLYQLGELFSLQNLRKVRNKIVIAKGVDYGEDEWLDLRTSVDILGEGGNVNRVKLSDVFDEHGRPKLNDDTGRKNFIKFINFMTHVTPDARFETVIKEVIANRAAELHGLSETLNGEDMSFKKDYAQMVADGWLYYWGMYFYLDNELSGRSEGAKLHRAYRMNRLGNDASVGNLFMLPMFDHTLLPESLVLTLKPDPITGKRITIQQHIENLQSYRVGMDKEVERAVNERLKSGALRERIRERIRAIDKLGTMNDKSREEIEATATAEIKAEEWNALLQSDQFKGKVKEYNTRAAVRIDGNAEQRYIRDHLQKAFSLEAHMLGKKKLEFAKYTHEDPMYGTRIDMTEWVKDFGDFANKLRKWLQGTEINPETVIEGWDYKKKEWGEITIGNSMVGLDILKYPEFVTDGKVDYKKINASKESKKLFARVVLAGFIVAQILQFRESAEWNRNPRYNYAMLRGILETIEAMPGNFKYEEGEARAGHSTEKFFPEHVYKWILTKTGNRWYELDGLEGLKEFFFGSVGKDDGIFAGTAEGFALFFKACFEGVAKS